MSESVRRKEGEGGLVEVALPLPLFTNFTYRLPEGTEVRPGTRVLVPFRREERVGWVVGPGTPLEGGGRIRGVLDVLDEEPSVTPDILELARWMADYYVAPLGLVLRSALPAVLTDSSRTLLALTDVGAVALEKGQLGGAALSPRERSLLASLETAKGPRSVRSLRRELGKGSIWPEIRRLGAAGALVHETVPPRPPPVKTRRMVHVATWLEDLQETERIFGRARRQREAYDWLVAAGGSGELSAMTEGGGFSRSVIGGLEGKGLVEVRDEEVLRDPFADRDPAPPPGWALTAQQEAALVALREEARAESPRPVVLHGVTGSGKTLVYIEFLREVLARGRSAIILVPEISLTPQTVSRFRSHFGDLVAVLHSGLSDGERYDAWRQLRAGEKRIAVGARSAIFAPLPDLGAVVVDEEHEGTYKQSEAPRYHGRDLAVVRAQLAGAACVLGSATPSLESWANAESGKYRLISLPERVSGRAMPPVKTVDLRTLPADRRVLSDPLVAAVRDRLSRGEQVILLLNRRGYSSFVQCRDCGDVRECPHCSISLTYHRVSRRLLCHHCRYEEPAPEVCSRCGSGDLSFRGLGTEQVERLVSETFPEARLARMDVDTTSGKWSHHEILGRVERGEVDILLGTQMIAKGLDFPRVTLVGVVNADVGIHLPDFRATERVFQLLSQVAGRTGRGSLGGEVLIQTAIPEHYAIRFAMSHDFNGFAAREMEERRRPVYPPHVRLVNVVVSSPDPERAAQVSEDAAAWIRRRQGSAPGGLEIVGPAPSPIERLHGRWRWHFLLRSPSPAALSVVCRDLLTAFEIRGGGDVRLALDRDPVALL